MLPVHGARRFPGRYSTTTEDTPEAQPDLTAGNLERMVDSVAHYLAQMDKTAGS